MLCNNLEHLLLSQGRAVTLVRLGGKYLNTKQFQPLCHLPTKIYQSQWKFDEVLTETKMHIFETRCRLRIANVFKCVKHVENERATFQ